MADEPLNIPAEDLKKPNGFGTFVMSVITDRKVTAFGVVCALAMYFGQTFVSEFRQLREDSKADRATFREDLKEIRAADSSRTQRIVDRLDKVREAVEANTRAVERVKPLGMNKGTVIGGDGN